MSDSGYYLLAYSQESSATQAPAFPGWPSRISPAWIHLYLKLFDSMKRENKSNVSQSSHYLPHSGCILLDLIVRTYLIQGYDQRLIPVMVEGVPAMVQCLEFIGELIQQSQQQRQVFAAVLTAHLTSLHPNLPQSLRAAQQVCNIIFSCQRSSSQSPGGKFISDRLHTFFYGPSS